MWQAARNMMDKAAATLTALQIFDDLSRSTQPEPKMALGVVRAVVLALIEGFQGKIPGTTLQSALVALGEDLRGRDGIPDGSMIERFKGRLG